MYVGGGRRYKLAVVMVVLENDSRAAEWWSRVPGGGIARRDHGRADGAGTSGHLHGVQVVTGGRLHLDHTVAVLD